jgi:hypothetical protein
MRSIGFSKDSSATARACRNLVKSCRSARSNPIPNWL